jgi:hypothetical protein
MKNSFLSLGSVLLLAGVTVVSAPRNGFTAQTLSQCLDAAAVTANNCYMNNSSSFMKKMCDIEWLINIERCILRVASS